MSNHIAEDEIANLEAERRDEAAKSAKLRTQNTEMQSRINWLDQVVDSCMEALEAYDAATPNPKMTQRLAELRELIKTSRVNFRAVLSELEK